MFKLFVFACLLAVAAASGAGVVSTYAAAPSVVSPYSYSSPLAYTGYTGYPYAGVYGSPYTYGSYGTPYARSLAYSGYGGYYSGYPYGYKYVY
ncbi:sulfur globule protein CV3-like [Lutzomyia longipalpis]|uniref:sulfur globule protein CV3-like n=1 Tax=Lutzomyia longipalpis TaxID=7200 RepID=UPI002483C867|nr:sulfur globule protein CV3-like [Lutzomyia longipalpis]